jgi:hypothetical protein
MSKPNQTPFIKKLFSGFLLCILFASLNSCITQNQCIYSSNNLLEKGKYDGSLSFSINSSYSVVTEASDTIATYTDIKKVFYPNSAMMGYYFRYGINRRWELGGGGDFTIPSACLNLKLNSSFLLSDWGKHKLGLFTQISGSAGISTRELFGYHDPLSGLFLESGLNFSSNKGPYEFCFVPRVRYNIIQGKKMHNFVMVRDTLNGITSFYTPARAREWENPNEVISNHSIEILNRRRQFFSYGASFILHIRKEEDLHTMELSLMYDNLLPYISLGYRWPIN